PADDLPTVPFAAWTNHGFAAIEPVAPLEVFIGDMAAQLGAFPVERFRPDPASNRDYVVQAHWALYVENYLEGLHIPFVHPALARIVDCASYAHELHRYSSVQVALARDEEAAFADEAIPGSGERPVAACYWWIFPNLMLNFYPWGLSLNRVVPETLDRARVEFRSYVWDEEKRSRG